MVTSSRRVKRQCVSSIHSQEVARFGRISPVFLSAVTSVSSSGAPMICISFSTLPTPAPHSPDGSADRAITRVSSEVSVFTGSAFADFASPANALAETDRTIAAARARLTSFFIILNPPLCDNSCFESISQNTQPVLLQRTCRSPR